MINCPFCGKLTDPKLDNCPHCGGFLQKSSGAKSSAQRQTCPSCHALVQDGDLICVACGTNLLTGQKIAEERRMAKDTSSSSAVRNAAFAVVGLIVLIGLGIALYMLTRDPLKQALQMKASGQISEATKMLQDLTVKRPQDARVFAELGKVLLETNQAKQAADAFEKVISLDAGNREAALLGVSCLAETGDAASRAREVDILKAQVTQRPTDRECMYLLALAQGSRGDVQGQIDTLKKVVELDQTNADAHRYLATGLALKGDYAAAETEFNDAIQKQGDSGDALAAAGMAASLKGNVAAATAQLSDAIKKRTALEADALVQLGLLVMQHGQFQEAEDYLNRAKKLGRSETADFFHAVALQGQDMFELAVNEFDAIAKSSSSFAALANVNLAQIFLAQGNVDKAREAADKATAQGNSSAQLLTVRGRVLERGNNDTGAQDMFKKAIQSDPNYAPAHLENGLLYVKRQIPTEGIRELEQYLQLVAGAGLETGGVKDIRALVDQLRQSTLPDQTPPAAPAPAEAKQGALS